MAYSANFPSTQTAGVYTSGGQYVDPITSQSYAAGPCNYAPVMPCFRKDFLSSFIYETKPYNEQEFSLNNFMKVMVSIRDSSKLAALDSAITLNPVISTAQRQAISKAFYKSNVNN